MRLNGLLAIAIMISIVLATETVGAGSGEPMEFRTNGENFSTGVPIFITMENAGDAPLYGTPYCSVYDEDGNVVQGFYFAQFIRELRPGEMITLMWDQADMKEGQVETGTYYITAGFAGYEGTMKVVIGQDSVKFSTLSDLYPIGISVPIFVENVGNETLYGVPTYNVYNEDGNLVKEWCPLIFLLWELAPEERIAMVWDPTDMGEGVEPGTYYITAEFAGYGTTLKVEIASIDLFSHLYMNGDTVEISLTNRGSETLSFGSGFVIYDRRGKKVVDAAYRHMDTLAPGESLTYLWGIGPDAKGNEWDEAEGDYHGPYLISTFARNISIVQSLFPVYVE